MQDLRVGDILLNHYASERNPGRKTVVVSISPRNVTSISQYRGKIHKCNYSQRDVRWNKKFEVVGHIDLCGMIQHLLDGGLKIESL